MRHGTSQPTRANTVERTGPYVESIAPHERCTSTSPAKARHVLRVHQARRGTTELIFEDRTLARAHHRVLGRSDGIYGATLLEQFGGDGQDLGGPSRCW